MPSAPPFSGTRRTAFTPLTARAAPSSTDARRAPNTGGRATTAVNWPGRRMSMPKSWRPLLFAGASRRGVGRPDDAEVPGVLQRDGLGHGQRHGGLGQLAIAGLAVAGPEHGASLRAQR